MGGFGRPAEEIGRPERGGRPPAHEAWPGLRRRLAGSVFCDVYGWRQEGRFAVIPSLLGKPVLACLPGLGYTDLSVAGARELAQEVAGRSFNIRVLAETPGEPPPGAPAVFRLDLAAFDHEREAVTRPAAPNGNSAPSPFRSCSSRSSVIPATGSMRVGTSVTRCPSFMNRSCLEDQWKSCRSTPCG